MIRFTIAVLIAVAASPAFSAAVDDWEDAVLARIPESFPMVVDASWERPGSLRLFVEDNGYGRNGVAETACGTLRYVEGTPPTRFITVRVFNAGSASVSKGSEMLGYGECNL